MSIESEARAEAEKNYLADSSVDGRVILSDVQYGFIQGYIAGATREVTDAEVEAAKAAYQMAQDLDPYDFSGRMRAALTATRQVETTNHEIGRHDAVTE